MKYQPGGIQPLFRVDITQFGYIQSEKLNFINDLLLGQIAKDKLLGLLTKVRPSIPGKYSYRKGYLHNMDYNNKVMLKGVFVGTLNDGRRHDGQLEEGVFIVPVKSDMIAGNAAIEDQSKTALDACFSELNIGKNGRPAILQCTSRGSMLSLEASGTRRSKSKSRSERRLTTSIEPGTVKRLQQKFSCSDLLSETPSVVIGKSVKRASAFSKTDNCNSASQVSVTTAETSKPTPLPRKSLRSAGKPHLKFNDSDHRKTLVPTGILQPSGLHNGDSDSDTSDGMSFRFNPIIPQLQDDYVGQNSANKSTQTDDSTSSANSAKVDFSSRNLPSGTERYPRKSSVGKGALGPQSSVVIGRDASSPSVLIGRRPFVPTTSRYYTSSNSDFDFPQDVANDNSRLKIGRSRIKSKAKMMKKEVEKNDPKTEIIRPLSVNDVQSPGPRCVEKINYPFSGNSSSEDNRRSSGIPGLTESRQKAKEIRKKSADYFLQPMSDFRARTDDPVVTKDLSTSSFEDLKQENTRWQALRRRRSSKTVRSSSSDEDLNCSSNPKIQEYNSRVRRCSMTLPSQPIKGFKEKVGLKYRNLTKTPQLMNNSKSTIFAPEPRGVYSVTSTDQWNPVAAPELKPTVSSVQAAKHCPPTLEMHEWDLAEFLQQLECSKEP